MIEYQSVPNRFSPQGANIWGDSPSGCLVAGRSGQGDPAHHSCCQLQHGDDDEGGGVDGQHDRHDDDAFNYYAYNCMFSSFLSMFSYLLCDFR